MDPVQMDEWQKEYKNVRQLFEASNFRDLGRFAPFQILQSKLQNIDQKACSSLSCPHGIHPRSAFYRKSTSKDGLRPCCKYCSDGTGMKARVEAGHKRNREVQLNNVNAKVARKTGAVEDEAIKWIKEQFEHWFVDEGMTLQITPEFRNADLGIHLKDWQTAGQSKLFLPVQVKSSGSLDMQGRKVPNNSLHHQSAGGSARFAKCSGYKGCLMLFVKSRMNVHNTTERTIWWCWGEDVTKHEVFEGTADGTSSNHGYKKTRGLLIVDDKKWLNAWTGEPRPTSFIDFIRSRNDVLRPWKSLWLDVRAKDQRKEMISMLCLEQVGSIDIPIGFQTAIDCTFLGKNTQVKCLPCSSGTANASHRIDGIKTRPYCSSDGVDQLVEVLIVKSNATFFLMFAVQPREKLIEHGIFSSRESAGQTTITVPFGKYCKWLKGEAAARSYSSTEWLVDTEYGWQQPVKLVPNDWLTTDMLNEVAHVAARPDLSPVEF